jgi:cell division protease FtsH
MLSLSAAACAYSLNAPVVSHHVAPRSGRPVLAMSPKEMGQSAAVAAALAATLATSQGAFAAEPWAYSTLLDKTGSDEVSKVVFAEDGKGAVAFDQEGKDHPVQLFPGGDSELVQELRKRNVAFAVAPRPTPGAVASVLGTIGGVLLNFAPLLLLIGLNVLASRGGPGGAGGGGGPMGQMQVGKSKSQIQMEPNTGVTFEDVAGCDGSKQELTEVVDFLKNPAKYSALGAKIPRGAIMEGPPGTGKTLLARAVAGEAGVPFISASGSEFVEMFVGVGASRVRDLFEQAKKNAPCIVFIDEIDAIGGARAGGQGGGMGGGGNDEREQTLNQILTEMDGFDGNSGVIVLAATNRADMLDSALVRPGRFDRRVPVDLPDVKGRREILNVHVRGKPLAKELDLDIIAKRTIGFSGASLANLMNEAAIVAARNDKEEIGYAEVDFALDRLQVGMQKNTGMSFPARQRLVAYHEAGHAAMALLVPDYDQVTKVTIVPRTNGAGGFTLFTPSEERLESGMYSKRYLEGQLAVALGGRCAEEIIYGEDEVTTGASNDLQQVRSIARRMVAQWGFAMEAMGDAPVAWETGDNSFGGIRPASVDTEAILDREVQKLVQSAYDRAMSTLTENRALMEYMTDRLIEAETIDYDELQAMTEAHVNGQDLKQLQAA